MIPRGGKLTPSGPTNLDLECKKALELLLKPANFPVIVPWMQRADNTAKRDVVKLLQVLDASDAELQDQRSGYVASREQTLVNRHGRTITASAVPVTADRAQVDLLRNRCGFEQRDKATHAKRGFFSTFADVHSTTSVETFHRLQSMPAASDAAARILTESARRRLQRWQVRGPERSPEDSAVVMRALRSLSNAHAALPSYHDLARDQSPSMTRIDLLREYARVAPKGAKTLNATVLAMLQPSASAPALLPPFRPFIGAEELDAINRPGGDTAGFLDDVPLQMRKNQHRASKSKMTVAGGERDWTTSYGLMSAFSA